MAPLSKKKRCQDGIYIIGIYIINRTLHGRLEMRNFSSRVEKLEEKFRIFARPCNILYLALTAAFLAKRSRCCHFCAPPESSPKTKLTRKRVDSWNTEVYFTKLNPSGDNFILPTSCPESYKTWSNNYRLVFETSCLL